MNSLDFLFYSAREARRYIPKHFHECFELVYYFGGSGESQIGNRRFTFRDNMFAVISPGTVHDEKHDIGGEVLFIGFHTDNGALRHIDAVIHDDEERRIKQLILRMNEEFTGKRQGYSEMLNYMAGELAIQIQRLTDRKKSEESSLSQLQYVRNYMEEHYRQSISIESLARMSGYSYDRFRHLFKETYGIAPLQFLFKKRLEYAKLLLYETSLQISEIASSSGFSNETQFCAMFKRENGITAKGFRKRKGMLGKL